MDFMTLIRDMTADGSLNIIASNTRAQFGARGRPLLGATILPEKLQPQNEYTETGIKYRTIIANDGTRYSPTQIKGGMLTGSMRVTLAESDIASQLTARDLDALIALLNRNLTMQGAAQVTSFVNTTINMALAEINEKHRWEAIVDATVLLRGDNEYTEDVSYSDPAGHRVASGGDWTDPTYDPFDDIYAQAALLVSKGFSGVARMVTSTKQKNVLLSNPKVVARMNPLVTISAGGSIGAVSGRGSLAGLNSVLAADGLPGIETYDLQYRTSTGTARFMADDVFVMVASTGLDESIDLGDRIELLPNVLGYMGIGRPAGQSDPGRVIRSEVKMNKPPRVENEGWQTSLPVITEPEGLAVINSL